MSRIQESFEDEAFRNKIANRLPHAFQLAGLDASRDGKLGMEAGSAREKVIIGLLIQKYGRDNVETRIPITEKEIDVKVCGEPISIKTISSAGMAGVKVSWTVDAVRAREFGQNYSPSCDILLARIKWEGLGGLYLIPTQTQREELGRLGWETYLKLPKPDTNPRGVEISATAMERLLRHRATLSVPIMWKTPRIDFDPYKRWVDYWGEN